MIDARSLAKKIGLESGHGNFSRAERGDPSDTLARKQRGGPAQAARDKRASNYLKRAADLRKRERAAPKSVALPTPKDGAAHSASQPCLPTVGSGGAAAASSLESSSADDAMVSASGSAAAQAAARTALAAAQAGEPSHNGGAGIVGYTGYKSKCVARPPRQFRQPVVDDPLCSLQQQPFNSTRARTGPCTDAAASDQTDRRNRTAVRAAPRA